MKPYVKYVALGLAGVALAGCASFGDINAVDSVRAMPPSVGGTFSSELSNQYRTYAIHEADEAGEWDHAARFARKAEQAAKGASVEPFVVSDWPVSMDRAAYLNTARAQLMDDFAAGARDRMPAKAAYAQVMFDCWLEEEAENNTDSKCRSEFLKTEPMLRMMKAQAPAPMPAPVVVPIPGPYEVYFDFNSSALTSQAKMIIDDAAKAAGEAKVSGVVLIGHADRSGSDSYNMKLSRARVDTAANALVEDGFPRDKVTTKYAGETSPQVPTPDGQREAKNRRVEIIFER
ncbi:OmpA family protein [Varunaivibrio sulfuroxidans]|uniref:OmpA family protein n=1 Tax=Varunaivibrio sulfuroxidans TaxID=1773489 RepID=A0A4R3J9S1_9PROT|nr:OmpA family protein [Varunaivibrio sulfuroxidans]TCS62155.1 OmpA family protein [Varunaivibrio sulfuroxidans]WES30584.1 OmpA family protein [Varunaivibrio sulfuroxidans]